MAKMTFGTHAESPPKGMLTGVLFRPMVRLNERTNDGRLLRDTGFHTRELPLPFSAMTTTGHGMPSMAAIAGHLDYLEVEDDGVSVPGAGWLLDSPEARQVGRLIQAKALRGNSVELSPRDYDVKFDFEKMKVEVDFVDYDLIATTAVGCPAMDGCTIELEDPEFDFGDVLTQEMEQEITAALADLNAGAFNPVTSAMIPVGAGLGAFSVITRENESDVDNELVYETDGSEPPADWFAEQEAHAELFSQRVEAPNENGLIHVYGFVAGFDSKHLAVPGIVITPPRSESGYAYFANGETLVDDGTFVATGVLTYGGENGHADKALDWQAAQRHYDESCKAWAAVAIGENEHGIWYSGYALPDTPNQVITRCRALGISGDWRRVGGRHELLAALSVNARGYPLPKPSAFSHEGRQVSLIGAGAIAPMDPAEWQGRGFAAFEDMADAFRDVADYVRGEKASREVGPLEDVFRADQIAEAESLAAAFED